MIKRNRVLLSALASALILVASNAAAQSQSQPAAHDTYALSKNAPKRVLFVEDFEGDSPREFVQWYGRTVPWTLKERALTEEEALSGKRSFKITIEAPEGGAGYFWIPVKLPDDYATLLAEIKGKIDAEIEAKHHSPDARRVEDIGERFN